MFKSFKDFLTSKSMTQEQFDSLEADKQLNLYNEHNEALKTAFEQATAESVNNETLDKFKAEIMDIQSKTTRAVEALGLAIKAQAEKGGLNVDDMTKSELIELMEKSSEEVGKDGNGKVTDKYAKVDATQLMQEVTKAAALMTTANIIGANGAGSFSPLFGNYIDNRIHAAPMLYSTIMEDITVTTQVGTESIVYTERVNEEGDAEWLAEGAAKPLADAEWRTTSVPAKEVAVFWKFTHRFLFHTRLAVQDFDRYARELMENKIPEGALLGNTTTTSTQPNGITTLASAWVAPATIVNTTYAPNVYDAALAIATAVRIRGYRGVITIRLNDVWSYMMKSALKDTLGQYILPPFVSPDGTRVDNVRIKFDSEIPATKILGGVLSNYNFVICEDIMYFEGYENDDFRKNLISRKLEAFANGYLPSVHRPSVIYADIDEILEDINLPIPTAPLGE